MPKYHQGGTTMTTQTTIDIEALRRAVEERDAAGMLALYADDAEVRLADRDDTPGNPRVLSGKDEIRAFVEDVCARDMTHRVEHAVADGDRASLLEACRYPDGTNVRPLQRCRSATGSSCARSVCRLGMRSRWSLVAGR